MSEAQRYVDGVLEHADELRDELLRLALNAETESVRLAAIKELNERAFGKTAQGAPAAEVSALTMDELRDNKLELGRRVAWMLRQEQEETKTKGTADE